jgi:radical SAM superfamily enzyme YgiQ (UPF0313 family)
LSVYDQGRQPFGLASPAAWLRNAGVETSCADLSVSLFPARAIAEADFAAFFLPMHTATRMAVPHLRRVREVNPSIRLACYGLYAPLNREHLQSLGVDAIFGGEFEDGLLQWMLKDTTPSQTSQSLPRLQFQVPDRQGLASLSRYAKLRVLGEERTVGYTEASRGCKHMCRHCPVVPVYQGAFRAVQSDVVLADIRQQVAAGAQHITFGDPDFWNGPTHASRILAALHDEFPDITFDATIKIEHLRKHRTLLPQLREAGCLFVTSAVESLDDHVLEKLEKGHTRADFLEVIEDFKAAGLTLSPTFIAFHPWTTLSTYRDFLRTLRDCDLVANTAPVQLALRLLIPQASRMLEIEELASTLAGFDAQALSWKWRHPDSAVDDLARRVFQIAAAASEGASREEVFERVWKIAFEGEMPPLPARATIPYLTEPWYC